LIEVFSDQTADQVWCKAIKAIMYGCNTKHQKSRLGNTRELLHVNLNIKKPQQRWVLSRQPSINPAFAIADIFWILSGANDAQFMNFWNPILPRFAGHGSTYHGAYGYRIRKQFGIDQLERAFHILKHNPESRQVIIQIWDPKIDLPSQNGSPVSPDIPCNLCSMPKIREGKLEWFQIMRSNDIYRGTPYNLVQFTTLQEILAGWLGVELGGYYQVSDSLHIYDSDLPKLEILPQKRSINNNDQLGIGKKEFDVILKLICILMTKLTEDTLTRKEFDAICNAPDLPVSYRNLLLIAAADSARRRDWIDEMNVVATDCTNPVLSIAWQSWQKRWCETANFVEPNLAKSI
tara:strand:- start:2449 stop:3492 length:1044 start_codon:yes stop_codon:yes gene_type:complete